MVVSWVAGGGSVGFGSTVFWKPCTRCKGGTYVRNFVDAGVVIQLGPPRVFTDEERVLALWVSRLLALSVGHLDLQCPIMRQ